MTLPFCSARSVGIAAVFAVAALMLPGAASATTGVETTLPVSVVLTDKGAVWKPALGKLHPDTNTTYEIKVVNKTTQAHSFRLGYRETKVLAKGASQFFYYSFHLVGPTRWQVKHGTLQGGSQSGVFQVKLQKSLLSGGAAG